MEELKNYITQSGDIWVKGSVKGSVRYGEWVTTPEMARAEDVVALGALQMVAQSRPWATTGVIDSYINEYENSTGHTMHEHQKDAVKMVVNNNLSIVTGGPGTGKTTTLKCATFVLRKIRPDLKLVYAAPTGKAARRITESTGEPASTLHHLMGLGYDNTNPHQVNADVVIVDESSMNDLELSSTFFPHRSSTKKWCGWGISTRYPPLVLGLSFAT